MVGRVAYFAQLRLLEVRQRTQLALGVGEPTRRTGFMTLADGVVATQLRLKEELCEGVGLRCACRHCSKKRELLSLI